MAEVVLKYENIDITSDDMDSLRSYSFVNDKIINFYLKYLHRTLLNNEQQQKVHIFDSFFSEALDQMDDNRVGRWLRRVDVFDKDYLMVPAIIDQHWFLVVICFPYNLNKNNVPRHKRPCIITIDSMRSHTMDTKPQLIRYIYGFIRKACVFQRNMSAQDIRDLALKMNHIEYDVPEQRNNYDCGICLMQNAEKFLIDRYGISGDIDPEVQFRLSRSRLKRNALRGHIRKLAEATQIERTMW